MSLNFRHCPRCGSAPTRVYDGYRAVDSLGRVRITRQAYCGRCKRTYGPGRPPAPTLDELPDLARSFRDCPHCGGRPSKVYAGTYRDGKDPTRTRVKRSAKCSQCRRHYGPGRDRSAEKPFDPATAPDPQSVTWPGMSSERRWARYQAEWPALEARARRGRKAWGTSASSRARDVILWRDGGRCIVPVRVGFGEIPCGNPATEVDHITPISAGGAVFDPANLRASCHPCNQYLLHMMMAARWAAQRGAADVHVDLSGWLAPRDITA